jgi:hypothetical protein
MSGESLGAVGVEAGGVVEGGVDGVVDGWVGVGPGSVFGVTGNPAT